MLQILQSEYIWTFLTIYDHYNDETVKQIFKIPKNIVIIFIYKIANKNSSKFQVICITMAKETLRSNKLLSSWLSSDWLYCTKGTNNKYPIGKELTKESTAIITIVKNTVLTLRLERVVSSIEVSTKVVKNSATGEGIVIRARFYNRSHHENSEEGNNDSLEGVHDYSNIVVIEVRLVVEIVRIGRSLLSFEL